MSHLSIANKLINDNWMILPSLHQSMVNQFDAYLAHGPQGPLTEEAEQVAVPQAIFGNTMLVSIDGIIGRRLSMIESMCGGVDLNAVMKQVKEAAANPAIENVLFDISSPGGTVTGVAETAALIKELG